MGDHAEHDQAAERLFTAVLSGDVDAVLAAYGENAVMRMNGGTAEFGPAEIAGIVQLVSEKIPDFNYTNIRRQTTDTGFVEQHLVTGTGVTGEKFAFEVCAVGKVEGGRVTVLDEYADSALMAPMGLF